jgi:hypothetical protein
VRGLWPPPKTTSVAVSRPNYDSRGNRGNALTFTLDVVASLSAAMSRPRLGDGQENRFIQDSFIFIKRDTIPVDAQNNPILGLDGNPVAALQAGDSITYNGEKFNIAGKARGNEDHPFTRSNLGWMGFRMQGAG